MDPAVKQVDPHQGQVGRGHCGFLHQPQHPAGGVELGDAEALGIINVGQEDLGRGHDGPLLAQAGRRSPGLLRFETADEIAQVLLEKVVPQVHDEVLVA